MENWTSVFFIGVAGTGMSAIAQFLAGKGAEVSGSDREFSPVYKTDLQLQLEAASIKCFPQDGTGITGSCGLIVASAAIEESNPEIIAARKLGIAVIMRSEMLAQISAKYKTIAVGGTSGKSTTAAMVFHIMQKSGLDPSLITGAGLSSLQKKGLLGNAWVGKSDWLVIEADESDGSIVGYKAYIGLLLNIDRDHKEMSELRQLFSSFKANTSYRFIVNRDCAEASAFSSCADYDFSSDAVSGFRGSSFEQKAFISEFSASGLPIKLNAIGKHNMYNALAAMAGACAAGVPAQQAALSICSFEGIYRRTQLAGIAKGIYVIDDFAHNPAEVAAAIRACQGIGARVCAWFQPHGYGPLRFMKDELISQVRSVLRDTDIFAVSDIYYAGGTVDKNISAEDVAKPLQETCNAAYLPSREKLPAFAARHLGNGGVLLLMGARDPGLADFARHCVTEINNI
jgi:UDP-N-acetylmuramate--alanine ligase